MASHPTADQTSERFKDDKSFTMEELRWYYRGATRLPEWQQRMSIEMVQQVLNAIDRFETSSNKLGVKMKWLTIVLVILTLLLVVLGALLVPEIRGLLKLPAEHP